MLRQLLNFFQIEKYYGYRTINHSIHKKSRDFVQFLGFAYFIIAERTYTNIALTLKHNPIRHVYIFVFAYSRRFVRGAAGRQQPKYTSARHSTHRPPTRNSNSLRGNISSWHCPRVENWTYARVSLGKIIVLGWADFPGSQSAFHCTHFSYWQHVVFRVSY